jgi:transposase
MQGRKTYQEKLFTSFHLSERVPQDNFYRRLKNLLDLQWIYKKTMQYYGKEGQESIDPVVFFKLILIGYFENLGSDRRIINTVSMRLDMLYFIGYDIEEALPWHSTLSRTRQLYGEEIFKQLFRQVLKQCIDKKMVSGHCQVLDSGLIKANASMESLVEKEVLEAGDAYVINLKQEDQCNNSTGRIVKMDEPTSTDNSKVLKEVVEEKNTQADSLKQKEENKQTANCKGNSKGTLNETYRSRTDPDARVSTKPGKPTQLNYLAQVSVDTRNHVITNIEAHHADKGDSECLKQALTNTINNLEPEGLLVKEVLADSGYSNGEALRYLENNNIVGYIPNPGGYKPEREGFIYDTQNDQYICSQGTQLPLKRIHSAGPDSYKKEYRSSSKDCINCLLRGQCLGKATTFKKITETTDKSLYDRMNARMQSGKARAMMKRRQSTVEPVIGTLLNYTGMRRVNTRGIKQANKCMLMAATVYNLKKLLKRGIGKATAAIKEMEKLQQSALKTLFAGVGQLQYCNRKSI